MLLISTTRGHCRNVISIYYKGALQEYYQYLLQGGPAGMLLVSTTREHCRNVINTYYKGALHECY